jgi:beta-N-acetylhexosaminidase
MSATKRITCTCIAAIFLSSHLVAQTRDSLDIKIGQMILIGFPKPEVDAEVLREIKEGKVGSIIIFEKNIPAKNSFAALKKITWTYQQAAPIPLLICIDQEGGRVNRLKDKYGFPRSITAEAMGKSSTLDSVRFYSEATASTLAGLGINVNFAPVVDLASNRNNPIIAKVGRAFSANEDSVIMMAKEVVKQHRKFGVLTALKHFPGHGSSKDDTHLGIADVTQTWEERELKPYKALIDSGYVDAVMTSHIVNKNLEPDGHPGTLSEDILTGILRKQLHFDGVVFTDDMQMHAITKHYGLEDAIRLAVNAGVDIMTFSNNISGSDERTVDKVHSLIRGMVEKGVIKKERIDESYDRIMRMKTALMMKDASILYKQELQRTKEELAKAKETLTEHKNVIDKAAKKKARKKKKQKK